jgi:hypothetical protein
MANVDPNAVNGVSIANALQNFLSARQSYRENEDDARAQQLAVDNAYGLASALISAYGDFKKVPGVSATGAVLGIPANLDAAIRDYRNYQEQ